MIKTYTPSDRFGSNMYLVSDHASSVLIDPSTPPSVVCADFPGGLPHLDAILLTHAHFDHMLGIDEWVRQTGAPVYVGKEDADALSDPGKNAYRLFSGEDRGYTGAYHTVEDGQILCFPSFREPFRPVFFRQKTCGQDRHPDALPGTRHFFFPAASRRTISTVGDYEDGRTEK